jgi:hypothetical protein
MQIYLDIFNYTYMPIFEKHENIFMNEYDLDRVSGKLVSDNTIDRGPSLDSVRIHNRIWTPLDDALMPKAIIYSLHSNLTSISKKIVDSKGRELIHALCDTRDYINLYFNHTKTKPVHIPQYTRWSYNKNFLQKLVDDCALTLAYCSDPLGMQATHTITATSLALREVIAHTVWFNEVAHLPSQVKDKTSNFTQKAFLLDSYYIWLDNIGIIDVRNK